MNNKINKTPITRSTYRHGDLQRALLEAGVMLARDGGPDAIILREVTRRVGVAPNAAYRYFASRQELLQAIRAYALSSMAIFMENELAKLRDESDAANFARANLRAVGTGYLKFAQAEPGLFRTAFSVNDEVEGDTDPAKAGKSGLNPFQLLGAALDKLVTANLLTTENRQSAEYFAWSAVHGMAILSIDGPLSHLNRKQFDTLSQRLLDMVEKGL
ncbi:MAG: TetR/AcrR family transcriptional regulator [Gammaproteobacteria bacterium]|nr:TetR/AcrR family transcriptional regulator [Gammaproteobacteria bacterium]